MLMPNYSFWSSSHSSQPPLPFTFSSQNMDWLMCRFHICSLLPNSVIAQGVVHCSQPVLLATSYMAKLLMLNKSAAWMTQLLAITEPAKHVDSWQLANSKYMWRQCTKWQLAELAYIVITIAAAQSRIQGRESWTFLPKQIILFLPVQLIRVRVKPGLWTMDYRR